MQVWRGWWVGLFVVASLMGSTAQMSDAERAITLMVRDYEVVPNVTYLIANKTEIKLDIYTPREPKRHPLQW